MHRTRNAEYSQGYRGFESHPLRQDILTSKDIHIVDRSGASFVAGFFQPSVDAAGLFGGEVQHGLLWTHDSANVMEDCLRPSHKEL